MSGRGDERFLRELAEPSTAVRLMSSADGSERPFGNSADESIYGRSPELLRERRRTSSRPCTPTTATGSGRRWSASPAGSPWTSRTA